MGWSDSLRQGENHTHEETGDDFLTEVEIPISLYSKKSKTARQAI